jgi:nucleotide-binding universal stress UspA family protein
LSKKSHILIAVDGSQDSLRATKYVAQTCPPADLRVTLMHVLPTAPETFWDLEKTDYFKAEIGGRYVTWKEEKKGAAQTFLAKAKTSLVNAGVAETEVGVILQEREVGIARDILAQAAHGYDAVVVGRRGLSEFQESYLGSVCQKIVEGTKHVPLWVVGGSIESKKILLAVDSSENSRRAVEYVGSIVGQTKTELALFHVIRRFSFLDDHTLRDYEIEGFWEEVKKDIPHMFRFYKSNLERAGVDGARISTRANVDSASRAMDILQEADEGRYGTIVMGRRGLSKVRQFLLGRVTNKVLQRAEKFTVWLVP